MDQKFPSGASMTCTKLVLPNQSVADAHAGQPIRIVESGCRIFIPDCTAPVPLK